MTDKVQKLLARSGLGSRREMEAVIAEGRVSVNGMIIELGARASEEDKIRVDGRLISITKQEDFVRRIVAYNKPEGEVCTRKDPDGRPTVFEKLPSAGKGRWIAIGRLDLNTSGLLLFTNDGDLANRLMHPRYELEREYAVRIKGEVSDDTIKQLKTGIALEDGMASFDRITFSGGEGTNQWYHVTLKEGRNREVRRMWEAVGCMVSRLTRVRYGSVVLERSLRRGNWVELDNSLVREIEKEVGLEPSAKPKHRTPQNPRRRKIMKSRPANKKSARPSRSSRR
ncbi:23S rRNA pseudouridine(2605) synthase RluB [Pleionea sp. CnH1-48]|uniref:23S rRNA pseudouridine(2605) synthase RluB n=1 Tax=Pleionea sp. CnH1-48 TaxID=2954494 RepID=UPI0020979350|nr:23S rRNA pseudouridine(2605) synthase RluB [Pleionea sp. CnH1-48]MCO7225556.1 23S rRNA pseudouridine(2605) synthase RluB [Pleionea sp. CnH1-48]